CFFESACLLCCVACLGLDAWIEGFCVFFQAEDGIRDFHVTGVQTCALPILTGAAGTGDAVGAGEASCSAAASGAGGSAASLPGPAAGCAPSSGCSVGSVGLSCAGALTVSISTSTSSSSEVVGSTTDSAGCASSSVSGG